MKRMPLLALTLLLLHSSAFAQTRADYEDAMNKIMRFYNNNQGDSISTMFAYDQSTFTQGSIESMRKLNGRMHHFEYMGINPEDSVILIKSIFGKLPGPHAIGMLLNKENKMETFRFFTSSHYIDSLLKQFP